MCHQNSARFCGEIAYDDDFGGIAADVHEGDWMAEVTGDKRNLFLAHHGVVVVVGASPGDPKHDSIDR